MIAKFVLFCLWALLSTINVATGTQPEFGTYKFINRARQSSLCSHHVGEPVYVPTQGYSCPQELWVLGPGDDHGLYTIKNAGLNSYVRANKTSGSFVVISNGKTSFTISSAASGGNGYIIKFPNSDLVWTVVLPTMTSHSDILLQPESGDDMQLWTLVRADNTIGQEPFAGFTIQTRNSQEEESNLAVLRGIEELGGSAGYQKYLESPRASPNSTYIVTAQSDSYPNSVDAYGSAWSAFIYTKIKVTAGEYSGSGHAWGIGAGSITFSGSLSYTSWDELLSGKNKFIVLGGGALAGGLGVSFDVNGQQAGLLKVFGFALGIFDGIDGTFTWKKCC